MTNVLDLQATALETPAEIKISLGSFFLCTWPHRSNRSLFFC